MQRNQYFKVQIFSLFIVTAPLVSWALTNITPENIESDEREENAQRFQDIDMLCRVKISLRENIQNELKCRYTNHGNAFLTLAPFTEAEEAYVEPRIVIFHDVISNDEIEILKKLTQPEARILASSGLSRGEISLPANIQKQLKCRYTDNGTPFLKIAPFKEEEAYLEPRIVIFHDIIYNEEIEILKKLTKPKTKLGEVKAGEERIQKGQIGQISWIDKDKHDVVNVFNRRIEHMTRLSVASAEPVQVCYYRIRGMFLQHFEIFLRVQESLVKDEDRIATLLYYVSKRRVEICRVQLQIRFILSARQGFHSIRKFVPL